MIKIGGVEIPFVKFPDGQLHCDMSLIEIPMDKIFIECRLASFDDIGKLLLVADILKASQWPIDTIWVSYLLGGRMDRRIEGGQPYTLKVVVDMLKSIKPNKWQFLEPHSDVLEGMIEEPFRIHGWDIGMAEHAETDNELKRILSESTIVTPDAGMHKKIKRFCDRFQNWNSVEASKVRNLKTGDITETKVHGNVAGKECLVVDDLCDGGRTFIELAKVLKSQGATKLYLAVCHGVFSNDATARLLEYYDHIYTTNSYCELRAVVIKNPTRITVIDVFN